MSSSHANAWGMQPGSMSVWLSIPLSQSFFGCRRFRDATPEDIEALTLDGMRKALEAQLHASNIEINVVGDVDPLELEDLVLKYLGTVKPASNPPSRLEPPITFSQVPAAERQQIWHLKDSDERATAYIAGAICPPQEVSKKLHRRLTWRFQ